MRSKFLLNRTLNQRCNPISDPYEYCFLKYECRIPKNLGCICNALLLLLQPIGGALLVARNPSADVHAGDANPIERRADCGAVSFAPTFLQGDPGLGIGGFDFSSPLDRVFAFDYDHTGKADHLVAYRPGSGALRIIVNRNGGFLARFAQTAQSLYGIGGFDLGSPADQALAYDFDHSGKLDHIVFYRPGTGAVWILKNNNGFFYPVYRTTESGIGGYDLKSTADRIIAYDYEHSGKLDHLLLYRPGGGLITILKNTNGVFTAVQSGQQGIGGYDLKSPTDLILAFDYESSGKLDHLLLYRPGAGAVWILKNINGGFVAVFLQTAPGRGIGGFDLLSTADRAIAYDYTNTGRLDHLIFYRAGTGIVFILRNNGGQFTALYQEGISGRGIGGYDLASTTDRIIAFDNDSKGLSNYLVNYRPGAGAFWILRRS